MTTIRGRVYVVGDNIDTDQIIPAEYLSLVPTIPDEYRKLGSYALAGLARTPDQPPFVPPGETTTPYRIIVAAKNFGCGRRASTRPSLSARPGSSGRCRSYARSSFATAWRRRALSMRDAGAADGRLPHQR